MKGIDKITARIEADAVADAARIQAETDAQCGVIKAEGEKTAQESYWRKVQEGAKAAEARGQRLAKAADMEARKIILSSKQEIVDKAFSLAEEKLRTISGDEYIDFLASQAALAAVTGREKVVLAGKDRKPYGGKVIAKANAKLTAEGKTGALTLSDEEGTFDGGLILRDGNISVNCTIEALMAQARETMASAVAAELFA